MNSDFVSPASASTSGVFRQSLACPRVHEGAAKGTTYLCVHRGSSSGHDLYLVHAAYPSVDAHICSFCEIELRVL